jgi:KaiC/GvpD/RAD55 family RecA-like ATPase
MVQYEWRLRIMARVEELANEVQQLSREELAAFRDWFRKYDSDEWDREIEEDVQAGRLDKLASEAIAEHKAGRTKEL